MLASNICEIFNDAFSDRFDTRIQGGAAEPLYQPAIDPGGKHTIFFREDFASSALHEIAHWCIAGQSRRLQVDYGYWYSADRDGSKQRAFETAEIRPQSLEWILSEASHTCFRISRDNFDEATVSLNEFRDGVCQAARSWLRGGLPPRAREMIDCLATATGRGDALDPSIYMELPR